MTQDGGFSPWQPWSQCSADCDTGSQYRRRSCDDPQPLGYGRECQGYLVEARQCNVHSYKGKFFLSNQGTLLCVVCLIFVVVFLNRICFKIFCVYLDIFVEIVKL